MCGELGGGVGGELFGSLVLLALPACNVHDCFPLLSSCSSQTSIHHRPETCERFEAFRLGRSSGIHFVQRSVVSPFVGCCIVRCVRSLDFAPPRAALFFLPPGPPCSAMEPTIHCPCKLQPNYRCCLLAVLIARMWLYMPLGVWMACLFYQFSNIICTQDIASLLFVHMLSHVRAGLSPAALASGCWRPARRNFPSTT